MMQGAKRDDVLEGATYKAVLGDGSRMYITVNEQGGQPFEVFVRYDDPALHEWIAFATRLISMLLRAGVPMDLIAREMQEIHSPTSGHMIPGTHELCPSMVARIGKVLERHLQMRPLEKAV